MPTTLTPAYGRDYASAKAVRADWEAGKDFIIADYSHRYDGKPCNNADMSGETVNIRYKGLRKIVVIKPKRVASEYLNSFAGGCLRSR